MDGEILEITPKGYDTLIQIIERRLNELKEENKKLQDRVKFHAKMSEHWKGIASSYETLYETAKIQQSINK